jgi:hypothetical protein
MKNRILSCESSETSGPGVPGRNGLLSARSRGLLKVGKMHSPRLVWPSRIDYPSLLDAFAEIVSHQRKEAFWMRRYVPTPPTSIERGDQDPNLDQGISRIEASDREMIRTVSEMGDVASRRRKIVTVDDR